MARRKGVLHWTPDPIGEAIHNLRSFSIDSEVAGARPNDRKYMQNSLTNVAIVNDDGTFTAWHVTDDPRPVVHLLEAGGDLAKIAYVGGHLCEGLHVTAVPDLYARHSTRRWSFLKNLSQEGKDALVSELRKVLTENVMTHYITSSEYDRAMTEIMHWQNGLSDYGPRMVGGQPYNVDVPEIAKKAGIADYEPADIIKVVFEGRFLDMTKTEAQEYAADLASAMTGLEPGALMQLHVCDALKANGWDGAFTRSDVSSYPEMAIWNGSKINRFGSWAKDGVSLSGTYKSRPHRQKLEFMIEFPNGEKNTHSSWPRVGELRDDTIKRFLRDKYRLDDYQISLVKTLWAKYID